MKFNSYTIKITDACNFNCSYCYQRKKAKSLDFKDIKKSIDFFLSRLNPGAFINFYGGEPLLDFKLIQRIVLYIKQKSQGKTLRFSITTNGSLLDNSVIDFFNEYGFSVLVSCEGTAQDFDRQKGSFDLIQKNLKIAMKKSNINLATNSVFTPESVGFLSDAIRSIADIGIQEIHFTLSATSLWDDKSLILYENELQKLSGYLMHVYKKAKKIPVSAYEDSTERGIFRCSAGTTRIALACDGTLWGCFLFSDYFTDQVNSSEYHDFCFGDIDSFIKNHEQIYPAKRNNYSRLRMNRFSTPNTSCLLCEDLMECDVCPVDAAFTSGMIGKVPLWKCQAKKILRKEVKDFWKKN